MSLPLASASSLICLTLFISKLCLCPSPGSEKPLGGLSSPVLDSTQLSPCTGGTIGAFGSPGTSRGGVFVTSWDAGGSGFDLQPLHCLEFPFHAGAGANVCSAGCLMLLHAFRAALPFTCKQEGCHCWPRSCPLLPHFNRWKFKRTGRILALDSSAARGAELKPHHPALLRHLMLLQPRGEENKGK